LKTVSNSTPKVGDAIDFTIKVTNNGPSAATGVSVNDILPAGYTYVSNTATQGTYDNATGKWTIGNLAKGANVTLTIKVKVNAAGTYANTATVTGSETDPDTTNNTSTITPNPTRISNLSIIKIVDNPLPIVGSNVVFTITVSNNGPNDATGVYVLESLPTGYEYVSNTADSGTYDQVTGIWTIGNLSVNAKAILKITAKVKTDGEYTNTATVKNNNEPDPDPSDDTSTAVTDPEILLIPDGFSPNGDGHNDKFVILHSNYMNIEIYIYNRWGNIVYESKNYQDDWDGDNLPDGTYYRIAVVRNTKANTTQKLPGYITLKR
jgi:uncharacterized repeat protein (TIGR01451 family)/gliding motility-associated-like protein